MILPVTHLEVWNRAPTFLQGMDWNGIVECVLQDEWSCNFP